MSQAPQQESPSQGADVATNSQNKDARLFAMLAHLLSIFTGFIGPLIIWLLKKDEHSFVDDQGKESLNFQITVCILFFALAVLSFVPFLGCVAMLAFFPLYIADLILCIMACIAANKGQVYRYPFAIRLIK